MINFEFENNYVSTILTKTRNFLFRSKNKNAFEAFVIERDFVNKMNQKTISLFVIIQQYYEKLIFDLIKIIIYEIILKDFLLKKHNWSINWKIRIMTFEKYDCAIDIIFEHRQKTMINEKKQNRKTCSHSKKRFDNKFQLVKHQQRSNESTKYNYKRNLRIFWILRIE